MDNYEFCAQWILEHAHSGAYVLDYGCGAGQIVKRLRNAGVAAFGCDVFYEGGDYSKQMDNELFGGGVIRRMGANRIPFETESFDFVVNNQVMEHVPDLDGVLNEILRVLKPGGTVLSLFPDRGVWREGHCGVPFLHWFSKGGKRVRVYYATLLRSIGFGYFKGEKSIIQWSRDFCAWLDQWTYYRARQDIDAAFKMRFVDIRHIEDLWLRRRLSSKRPAITLIPRWVQRVVVTKLAGLVFVASKAG